MRDQTELQAFLEQCSVDDDVFALRPDYRAMLVAVDGIEPGGTDAEAEELLARADAHAAEQLSAAPVEELPRVAAWREAYRAFGAKPQRTRNSLESLLRRAAADGLPRVNRLTDLYNAVSVLHGIPLGGEDLDRYAGTAHLVRATGDEPFTVVSGGEEAVEHPRPGEVVWCDDAGVTCRRWNWRQGPRTALHEGTTAALFILDALDPLTDAELTAAADDLILRLGRLGPDVRTARRLVTRSAA